ncbi:hypothetical protein ADIAL_2054 [Alkalibacterium sp. AK22]|uniref:hypothetical protein n=1 Tax=Alkalibacterium sp. AK22 TaxID=1229520 RepID=UPI0004498DF7|nr:hypothetical protein [Alkalibacterium sp. AK22]EXJ22468.1 hypothetical protein ADIAL_2054 [Alkalibacterium sp. AK22]
MIGIDVRLLVVLFAVGGSVHKLIQIRKVVLSHRLAEVLKNVKIITAVLAVVILALILTGLSLIDWLIVLSAVTFVYLSQLNKGFTQNGIIPIESGLFARGLISKEYPFEATDNWAVLEQSRQIKVSFSPTDSPEQLNYLDFDIAHKEKVLALLRDHHKKVVLSKENQGRPS